MRKDKPKFLYRRYDRSVPTAEDWYPTCEGMVKGTVFLQENIQPRLAEFSKFLGKSESEVKFWVRVCFWGGDDFGIEMDTYFPTDTAAFNFYHQKVKWLDNLGIANHTDLCKIGFSLA